MNENINSHESKKAFIINVHSPFIPMGSLDHVDSFLSSDITMQNASHILPNVADIFMTWYDVVGTVTNVTFILAFDQ